MFRDKAFKLFLFIFFLISWSPWSNYQAVILSMEIMTCCGNMLLKLVFNICFFFFFSVFWEWFCDLQDSIQHCAKAISLIMSTFRYQCVVEINFVLIGSKCLFFFFFTGWKRERCWVKSDCIVWRESSWWQWWTSSQQGCLQTWAALWLFPHVVLLCYYCWILFLHNGMCLLMHGESRILQLSNGHSVLKIEGFIFASRN